MALGGVPPDRRTPDHPPYAFMIGAAIRHLAEHGGSTQGAISDYIRAHYDGLPWAHDKLLPYYLGKLTAQGLFAVGAAPGLYVAVPDTAAAAGGRSGSLRRPGTGEEGGGASSVLLSMMAPPTPPNVAALRSRSSARKRAAFVEELVYVLALPCQKGPAGFPPAPR